MSHMTIPMSSSAPVTSLSHDRLKSTTSPQFKFGSLKYADVSKVEVLDLNENFAPSENPLEKIVIEKKLEKFDETGPDAELDTSQFTATTQDSSLADHSSGTSEVFSEKDSTSTSDNLNVSATSSAKGSHTSPNKSIFSIEFDPDHQPAGNITSDWDLTTNNTPVATPVATPVKRQEPTETPSGSSYKNKSPTELARVVSDAVRNILDSPISNSGDVSPQVAATIASPGTVANYSIDSSSHTPTSDAKTKSLHRHSTREESELEKAVEIDPTTEQELIHTVINDEEEANCIITDAILADSICALSSLPATSSLPASHTVSLPSPISTKGSFTFPENIVEETSYELRAAELSPEKKIDPSPDDMDVQFNDDTADDLNGKEESDVFVHVHVSDTDLDPRQNLMSVMDASSDSVFEQTTPKDSESEGKSIYDGANKSETGAENGAEISATATNSEMNGQNDQLNTSSNNGNEVEKSAADGQEGEDINEENIPAEGSVNGATADENREGPANDVDEKSPETGETNGSPDESDHRRPDGASESEQLQQSDLESTQDMTDVEENLRKASEDKARRQRVSEFRKRSSQSRAEGFSETSIEDLRQAVITKEAVIASADKRLRHSPSDAVLQYQERKSKYDIRQDQSLKITPNGILIGAVEPRPPLPTQQTRPLLGLKPGRTVLIEGIVNKPAQSFSISLQTAEQPDAADVAMLISPSFIDKSILCNTYFHDTWGAPQIYDKRFPFTKGKKFEIKIATDTHCFKVYVNGQRLLDYDHRMPVDRVRYLRLEGDTVFNNVECPFVLDLPYVLDVDHGFKESSGIMLDAFVWPKADMFELNLLCGEKARQTHASFMMKVKFFEDELVKVEMASFCNDRMGEQAMVEGDLNIQPGQDFKLRIIILERSLSIQVDGVEMAEYEHHLPIEKLGHVLIDGDISLYSVHFMRPNRRISSGLMLSTAYKDDQCCNCAIT